MPRFPHPLRWVAIWFLTLVAGFGVTTHSIVTSQRERCETFRGEEAPAAFDSFARYLGRRSGLSEEEINQAIADINRQLAEDLPVSGC